MQTTPTPELVALLELSERATPGPWNVSNGTDVFTELGAACLDGLEVAQNDAWQIADFSVGVNFVGDEELTLSHHEQKANAQFIAALVNWFRSTRAATLPQGVSADAVPVDAVRTAVADYMWSEGCDCCRGDDHQAHAEVLAHLLGVPPYGDLSGYDFGPYRTAPPPAELGKGDASWATTKPALRSRLLAGVTRLIRFHS